MPRFRLCEAITPRNSRTSRTPTALPCQCLHCTTATGPSAFLECSQMSTPPSAPCDWLRVSNPAWANSFSTKASKRRHSMAASTSLLHWLGGCAGGAAWGVGGCTGGGLAGLAAACGGTGVPGATVAPAVLEVWTGSAASVGSSRGCESPLRCFNHHCNSTCVASSNAPTPMANSAGVLTPSATAFRMGLLVGSSEAIHIRMPSTRAETPFSRNGWDERFLRERLG